MPNSPNSRIDAAIAEFLQAAEAGTPLARDAWLAKYPDLRPDLEEFLKDQSAFRHAAAPIDDDRTLAPALEPGAPATGLPNVIRYFGDYELLEEIARGGMGVVWKARQVSLNRLVAVKMILAGQLASEADVQRFRAEAEAAANLDHPNILPIYEVGEHEGQHYFSMKLIEGGSLADWIKTRLTAENAENRRGISSQRSSASSAVQILVKVARAVHFAHQRGILHRDLKPANVLIGKEGTPYVTDFGLAKHIASDSTLTQTGAVVGTPSYMAPEQARAEKQLTISADVYALGAMLYQMITGKPPFRGETPLATVQQVLEQEPLAPNIVNTRADPDLALIALKCLAKEPARRYESAAALTEELERWLVGDPLIVRPLGIIAQSWRWFRKNTIAAITIPMLGIFWGWSVGLGNLAVIDSNDQFLIPKNMSSWNLVWWIDRVHRNPALRWGAIVLAIVTTILVGWLLQILAKPKDRRTALGWACITGLIAMQVAALFVLPIFLSGGSRQPHPIMTDERLTELILENPDKARTALDQEAEYFKLLLPPDRNTQPPDWARSAEIGRLRNAAQRTNDIYVASWFLPALAFCSMTLFLGFSASSAFAADQMAHSGRGFFGRGSVFMWTWMAGATFLLAGLSFVAAIIMGNLIFISALFGTALAMGYLIISHRAIRNRWDWRRFEVLSVSWCALSIAILVVSSKLVSAMKPLLPHL